MKDDVKAVYHSGVWWYVGAFLGATAGLGLSVLGRNGSREGSLTYAQYVMLLLSPSIAMAVAFFVAVSGTLAYYRATPPGSPFVNILRVLVAAARKKHLVYPEGKDESKLFGSGNPPKNESIGNPPKNESIINVEYTQTPATMALVASIRQRSASLKENRVHQGNEMVMIRKEHSLPPILKQGGGIELSANLDPSSPHHVLRSNKETHSTLHTSHWRREASVHPLPLVDSDSAKDSVGEELFPSRHTNCLRWLDKAAIIEEPGEATQVTKWKLCTQTEVDETKYLLRLFPIWATFLVYGMVLSLGKTFFISQANDLDRTLSSGVQIPITFLLALCGFSKLVVKQGCVPLLNWFAGLQRGAHPRIRIGIGLLLSAFCCLIASFVLWHVTKERARESQLDNNFGMSIFWLVPQFCALGAMDGLVEQGIEDFFVDEVPVEQLWRCEPAFHDSVTGMGSMLGALMILVAHMKRPVWFYDYGAQIDKHYLADNYYFAVFVLSVVNFFVYGLVARKYPCNRPRNVHRSDSRKGSVKGPVACLEAISDLFSK